MPNYRFCAAESNVVSRHGRGEIRSFEQRAIGEAPGSYPVPVAPVLRICPVPASFRWAKTESFRGHGSPPSWGSTRRQAEQRRIVSGEIGSTSEARRSCDGRQRVNAGNGGATGCPRHRRGRGDTDSVNSHAGRATARDRQGADLGSIQRAGVRCSTPGHCVGDRVAPFQGPVGLEERDPRAVMRARVDRRAFGAWMGQSGAVGHGKAHRRLCVPEAGTQRNALPCGVPRIPDARRSSEPWERSKTWNVLRARRGRALDFYGPLGRRTLRGRCDG